MANQPYPQRPRLLVARAAKAADEADRQLVRLDLEALIASNSGDVSDATRSLAAINVSALTNTSNADVVAVRDALIASLEANELPIPGDEGALDAAWEALLDTRVFISDIIAAGESGDAGDLLIAVTALVEELGYIVDEAP